MVRKNLTDVTLPASEVIVNPSGHCEVLVSLKDVPKDKLLNHLSPDDVVNYFGVEDLIDTIGQDVVFKHFNIEN